MESIKEMSRMRILYWTLPMVCSIVQIALTCLIGAGLPESNILYHLSKITHGDIGVDLAIIFGTYTMIVAPIIILCSYIYLYLFQLKKFKSRYVTSLFISFWVCLYLAIVGLSGYFNIVHQGFIALYSLLYMIPFVYLSHRIVTQIKKQFLSLFK